MTIPTVKKTVILAGIAGTFFTGAYMIVPAQAQAEACTAEIQAINQTLQSTQLDAELQAKVYALRESAISRNSQGDAEGCMQDVASIKSLLGL